MNTWTDGHSRLVAAAAPPVEDTDLDRAWARVAGAADEGRGPAQRPRRSVKVVIGASVAAAVVSLSGVATAGFLGARTGDGPADGEDIRLGGPGERLEPSADDFREVLDQEAADIPFPSEAARQVSIDEHVRDLQDGAHPRDSVRVSTGAVRAWTAVHAVCSWANEWVVTGRTGDTAAHDEAARMLVDARHWPAITDLDPVQRTRMTSQDVIDRDGNVTAETLPDPTQFHYLRLVARAVESQDVAALGSVLADNAYCIGPSLVPDFRQALPNGFRGR